jgi:ATP-dependent Zn protease
MLSVQNLLRIFLQALQALCSTNIFAIHSLFAAIICCITPSCLPFAEDRALMFDREIRGQLAMLMGGRAAEQLTCAAVSTGAVDDIRRATDLALRSVSEYGLSAAVGPLNVGVLAAGSDDGAWLMRDNGKMATLVEAEVRGAS